MTLQLSLLLLTFLPQEAAAGSSSNPDLSTLKGRCTPTELSTMAGHAGAPTKTISKAAKAVVDAKDSLKDPSAVHHAQLAIAIGAYYKKDWIVAATAAEASLKAAQEGSDLEQSFIASGLLSQIHCNQGDIGQGLVELLALRRQVKGHPSMEARCCCLVAELANRSHSSVVALGFFTEARELALACGDLEGAIDISHEIATILNSTGDWDGAEQALDYAGEFSVGLESPEAVQNTKISEALCRVRLLPSTEAVTELQSIQRDNADLGSPRLQATVHLAIGKAMLIEGEYEEAIAAFEAGFAILNSRELFIVAAKTEYANALIGATRQPEALEVINDVIETLGDTPSQELIDALHVQMGLLGAVSNPQEAASISNKARRLSEQRAQEVAMVRAQFMRAWEGHQVERREILTAKVLAAAAAAQRSKYFRIASASVCGVLLFGLGFVARARYRRKLALNAQAMAKQHNEVLEQRLSEQKASLEAEMEIRQELERDAAASDRMDAIGSLTSGVAHDFNNLMTVVISSTEAVRKTASERLSERETAVLDQVLNAASSGASITRQLLALARGSSAESQLVNVDTLLQDIGGLLQQTLGDAIKLQVQPSDGFPLIQANESQLTTAIINLCSNSRDAIPESGQVTISVRCIADNTEEFVEVSVTDTGRGMSTGESLRACGLLYTTKPESEGTGLGLSIVNRFVERAGGQLMISSKPRAGTTITLRFPSTSARPTTSRPETNTNHTIGGLTVAIVDDKASVLSSVATSLKTLDCNVRSFLDATDAKNSLQESVGGLDLLLTDIRMPGNFDGVQLARWVRENRPEVPVILMTGDDCQDSQGFPLLLKPFTTEALSASIAQAIETKARAHAAAIRNLQTS